MNLERKKELLKNTKAVINLIEEAWIKQDSVIISLEDQSIMYISICDDLNDSYHGQGYLVRAKSYSSIYCFAPEIRDIFKELLDNLDSKDDELYTVYNNLILKLNELDPNLE